MTEATEAVSWSEVRTGTSVDRLMWLAMYLPPALSRAEWRRVNDEGHPDTFVQPHAALALAHAALPDGDPRKITRAELAAAQTLAIRCAGFPELASTAQALARLAVKLNAILPWPE